MLGKLNRIIVACAILGMAGVIASPQFNSRSAPLTSLGSVPDENAADDGLTRDESEADPDLAWGVPERIRTEKEIVAELSQGNSTRDTASLLRELQMVVAKSNPIESLDDDEE